MTTKISGYAYKSDPYREPLDRISVKISDFGLSEMIDEPFKVQSIEIRPDEAVSNFTEFLSYLENFGRLFEIVEIGDTSNDITKIRIKIAEERPRGELKAKYNKVTKQLLYPYPFPMQKPAAYRSSKVDRIVLLKRTDNGSRFFSIQTVPPKDLQDGEEVEILSNSDPCAVKWIKSE